MEVPLAPGLLRTLTVAAVLAMGDDYRLTGARQVEFAVSPDEGGTKYGSQLTWYETPTPIKIGLKPEQVRVSPLGNDAASFLEIVDAL